MPVVIAALIAAFIAVFTNYQSQRATNVQLRIAEQGQITDRYNAAVTNLGSRSVEIRLGGIYALQRLMKDSPRDQSTVIAVLCAFVRDQTAPAVKPRKPPPSHVPTDVQAALTVVGTRNTANDGSTTVVDLDHAQLRNAQLRWLDLSGADLTGADLTSANLSHVYGSQANLTNAYLFETNLSGADLAGANVTNTFLVYEDLTGVDFTWVNFSRTDLTGVKWSKNVPPPQRDGSVILARAD
jgi:hypothetical protein